jgi:hypothetical protein
MNRQENLRRSYRPDRITTLFVGESAPHGEPYWTPYPGFGNQPRFHKAMIEIIPSLPVTNGSKWKEY